MNKILTTVLVLVVASVTVVGCRDRNGGSGGPGAGPAYPPVEQQEFEFFVTDSGARVSLPDQLARGSTIAYILSEIDHTVPEGATEPWSHYAKSHDIEIFLWPWHGYGKPSVGRHAIVFGESARGRYLIASMGRIWTDDSAAVLSRALLHEMGHEVKTISDDCPKCKRDGNTWVMSIDGETLSYLMGEAVK